MKRLLLTVSLFALSLGITHDITYDIARAQSRQQVGITTVPTASPQLFYAPSNTGNWVILADGATIFPNLSPSVLGSGVPGMDGGNGTPVNWFTYSNVTNPALDPYGVFRIDKHANYSGGVIGNIYSTIILTTYVDNSGTVSFENGFMSILHNKSTQRGQNSDGLVAAENTAEFIDGSCEAVNCSPTWGSNIIASDGTGQSDPINPLIGIELDLNVNGTDVNLQRVPLIVQINTQTPTYGGNNVVGHASRGIDISGNGIFDNGILMDGNYAYAAIFIQPANFQPNPPIPAPQYGIVVANKIVGAAYLDESTAQFGFQSAGKNVNAIILAGTYTGGAIVDDESTSNIALQIGGNHSIADIAINTTSPNAIAISGTRGFSTIEDYSAAPFGLTFAGTYSTATTNFSSVSSPVAILLQGNNTNAIELRGNFSGTAINDVESTSPIVLGIYGVHSASDIEINTTSPQGLTINGNHSTTDRPVGEVVFKTISPAV